MAIICSNGLAKTVLLKHFKSDNANKSQAENITFLQQRIVLCSIFTPLKHWQPLPCRRGPFVLDNVLTVFKFDVSPYDDNTHSWISFYFVCFQEASPLCVTPGCPVPSPRPCSQQHSSREQAAVQMSADEYYHYEPFNASGCTARPGRK